MPQQSTFITMPIAPRGELPPSERPQNRLLHRGAGALSATELLACILSTRIDPAQELVSRFGVQGLLTASAYEMSEVHGIGEHKAVQVKAALELGRRSTVADQDERPQVSSPGEAANLVMAEMAPLEQEHLRLLLLDTKNRLLASPTLYIGNVNTTILRVAELFREAVRHNSTAMIVVHNHPSGDPTPSPEDVCMTRTIVEAGKLMGIDVLDHVVIGRGRFVSLKERGLGFK
jgi:DNA repair protein RadC